jgi:hypothetical protein
MQSSVPPSSTIHSQLSHSIVVLSNYECACISIRPDRQQDGSPATRCKLTSSALSLRNHMDELDRKHYTSCKSSSPLVVLLSLLTRHYFLVTDLDFLSQTFLQGSTPNESYR